jgi:7,8-dihydropterin-6-yl-methyl-4-(beta-D-ribofuranosyl)aminobenzene 5'-phosphate synthase
MCETVGTDDDNLAQGAMPRSAAGTAVDPITLEPVDEVVVISLVDNSFDRPGARRSQVPARRRHLISSVV